MQTFKILIDNRYTAATQTVTATTENIGLDNSYYLYNVSNGGGIVNFSNVRGYLNDQRNLQTTRDFFAYLTGNTTTSQALNILGSDEKLSNVFNDYYQRIVLSGTQLASTAIIQQNLTGATQIIGYTYNHSWNGYAPSKQLTGITKSINNSNNFYNFVVTQSFVQQNNILQNNIQQNNFVQSFSVAQRFRPAPRTLNDTIVVNDPNSNNSVQSRSVWQEFTREPSYYIPVYMQRGTNQLSEYKYEFCRPSVSVATANLFPEYSAITHNFVEQAKADAAIYAGILAIINAIIVAFGGAPIQSSAITTSHTIIDCFVDVNLETNENIYWKN